MSYFPGYRFSGVCDTANGDPSDEMPNIAYSDSIDDSSSEIKKSHKTHPVHTHPLFLILPSKDGDAMYDEGY